VTICANASLKLLNYCVSERAEFYTPPDTTQVILEAEKWHIFFLGGW